MIKCPVKSVKTDIVDSDNEWLASAANNGVAGTIANALNAMNTLPNFRKISDSADEGDKNEAIVDALNVWLDSLG